MMNGPLHQFFTSDHRRLEKLLDKATEKPDEITMEYYSQFRTGLLTHIKMEENILFVAAQQAREGTPLPIVAKLRLDHGALTALMVPPPSTAIIKALRHILEKHDLLEEESGGMYDACDALTQDHVDHLLKVLHTTSPVPVHPHNNSPLILDATRRALARAGYNFDIFAVQP
ncbi:MAG: hemerythrin domain-containing protein [Bacteroidota bacterium]|nr:hemerythrin domain-containing protein [Bacteroidota bacterium]